MQTWRVAGFRIVGHFVFPKRYTSSEKYLRYQHECAYLLAKDNPLTPQSTIGGSGPGRVKPLPANFIARPTP